MSSIRIRQFHRGDRDQVTELVNAHIGAVIRNVSISVLARPGAPIDGLAARRSLGINGTRISALAAGVELGYIEVDTNLDSGSRLSTQRGWADIGNLCVTEEYRRRGIGGWLLGGPGRRGLGAVAGVTLIAAYAFFARRS